MTRNSKEFGVWKMIFRTLDIAVFEWMIWQ